MKYIFQTFTLFILLSCSLVQEKDTAGITIVGNGGTIQGTIITTPTATLQKKVSAEPVSFTVKLYREGKLKSTQIADDPATAYFFSFTKLAVGIYSLEVINDLNQAIRMDSLVIQGEEVINLTVTSFDTNNISTDALGKSGWIWSGTRLSSQTNNPLQAYLRSQELNRATARPGFPSLQVIQNVTDAPSGYYHNRFSYSIPTADHFHFNYSGSQANSVSRFGFYTGPDASQSNTLIGYHSVDLSEFSTLCMTYESNHPLYLTFLEEILFPSDPSNGKLWNGASSLISATQHGPETVILPLSAFVDSAGTPLNPSQVLAIAWQFDQSIAGYSTENQFTLYKMGFGRGCFEPDPWEPISTLSSDSLNDAMCPDTVSILDTVWSFRRIFGDDHSDTLYSSQSRHFDSIKYEGPYGFTIYENNAYGVLIGFVDQDTMWKCPIKPIPTDTIRLNYSADSLFPQYIDTIPSDLQTRIQSLFNVIQADTCPQQIQSDELAQYHVNLIDGPDLMIWSNYVSCVIYNEMNSTYWVLYRALDLDLAQPGFWTIPTFLNNTHNFLYFPTSGETPDSITFRLEITNSHLFKDTLTITSQVVR